MTLQPRHFAFATLLHVVLFAALLFSGVQCSQKMETTPVVQGVLINPSDLHRLFPPAPPQPKPPEPKPPEPSTGPQPQVNAETTADEARQQQEKADQMRKMQEEKQRQDQQMKEEAAKREQLREQQIAQKREQDQAQLLKQQEEAAKKKQEEDKLKAEAAADQKKQAEEQLRKEAQREQQAQAAVDSKRKADAAQKAAKERKQREAELQQSLGVESAQLNQQIQNEWSLQLIAAITRAWARPPGTDQSLKAWLKITLSSTGEVQNASIATTSGVPLFDQTVRQAVYAASPLPLPRDASAFDPNITICFSPNPRNCSQ